MSLTECASDKKDFTLRALLQNIKKKLNDNTDKIEKTTQLHRNKNISMNTTAIT